MVHYFQMCYNFPCIINFTSLQQSHQITFYIIIIEFVGKLVQVEANKEDMDEFKSNTNYFVEMYMGPYESNGIIRHRIQRLRGLHDCLTERGYNVELITTVHLDRFTLKLCDREIFRCNIKCFQFNLPCGEDPTCMKVIEVLKEHEKRFNHDRNVPRYVNVKHGMRFKQNFKRMTTADMLSGSDVNLMLEIQRKPDFNMLEIPWEFRHNSDISSESIKFQDSNDAIQPPKEEGQTDPDIDFFAESEFLLREI